MGKSFQRFFNEKILLDMGMHIRLNETVVKPFDGFNPLMEGIETASPCFFKHKRISMSPS